MNSRRLCAALALSCLLAACSSSTSGKGSTGSSGAAGSSAAAPGGKPTDAAGLGGLMQSAIAGITSAHISLDIDAAGQKVSGAGDEKLSGGKLVAMDITEQLPGGAGSLQLIIVGGKTYAKLPASLNKSGKPYVLVTPDSSNPTVRALAGSLDSALSSASIGSVGAFITAAQTVKLVGSATVSGVKATHYSVVVDIAKLPADLPGKDALASSGLKTLPLDLYIDDQGRPVRVNEDFKVQGQEVASNVTVTNYNKPVTVTAPPASEVSTD
ncbi:MAG: hypothetical protein ABR571_00550 [Jatrophihabitans sp.]|uniref:hypothetical protein n=1 Tax=Jatrophihabitans sp. TaxID=1932789 RepID=UPI003914BC6D